MGYHYYFGPVDQFGGLRTSEWKTHEWAEYEALRDFHPPSHR